MRRATLSLPRSAPAPSGTYPNAMRMIFDVVGDDLLVQVVGPLDLMSAQLFLEEASAAGHGRGCMVIDLRRTDHIDSQGVRALMRLQDIRGEADGDVRLVVAEYSGVERTLTLLQLDRRFTISRTVPDVWTGGRGAYNQVTRAV